MKAYKYTTTNTNAIDNRELYFTAPLELGDVLRLVNCHSKYEYSVQVVELDSTCKVLTIREVLAKIDSIVLHETIIDKEHFDSVQQDYLCILNTHIRVSAEGPYWLIDLSDSRMDFKELSKDKGAMIDENCRVARVMDFLFRNDIDFEYSGSRAKLKVPMYWKKDLKLSIFGNDRAIRTLTVLKREWSTITRTIEIPKNN